MGHPERRLVEVLVAALLAAGLLPLLFTLSIMQVRSHVGLERELRPYRE